MGYLYFLFLLMYCQVAYWLLQHNISVMLAACDTFRSGAVEQLRTHARRLQVIRLICVSMPSLDESRLNYSSTLLSKKGTYLFVILFVR